jgi:hypothetical protein
LNNAVTPRSTRAHSPRVVNKAASQAFDLYRADLMKASLESAERLQNQQLAEAR